MKKAIILSFIFHITILTCFLVRFGHVWHHYVPVDKTIPVYIYHTPIISQQKDQVKQEVSKNQVLKKEVLLKNNKNQFMNQEHHVSKVDQQQTVISPAQQKKYSTLSKLLHDLIKAHITYSNVFLDFKRKQMKVSFVLFPDGHFEDLQILKTSGDDHFDQSVLTVVQSIQPIVMARNFLENERRFEVQIVFVK